MSDDSPHPPHGKTDEPWSALSALADGEASAEVQQRCLALWAEDAGARARWRHYHLIGDVLRSRELASEEAHDAAFLAALRERIAREPAVLRPPSVLWRLRSWAAPVAAAAGVAAVAAVALMLRTAPTEREALQVAVQPPAAQPMVVSAPIGPQDLQPVNGRLIRDARLDRYFAAHRQSATGAALQMPGSMMRSVDTIVLEDR